MNQYPTPANNNRLGMHYFPDTYHYNPTDLAAWLPELKALGISWIILPTTTERSIPEDFIRGLVEQEIEPILHLNISLNHAPTVESIRSQLTAYRRWGVHYIALFDRPNMRSSWHGAGWVQQGLVDRFLDLFIPLAEEICHADMFPIFPALEPGGDYWDTAFLRTALKSILERGHHNLIEKMVLGSYAWPSTHMLNWGAGGPERWPGAKPYTTAKGEQDQRGFRIMDWYAVISRAALNKVLPIVLMGTGCSEQHREDADNCNLQIAQLLAGESVSEDDEGILEAIPDFVLAGNFWLLSASENNQAQENAWYKADRSERASVSLIKEWIAQSQSAKTISSAPQEKTKDCKNKQENVFEHYVLLPSYEWGASDYHLDVIRKYMKKHRPTVGFSIPEAMQSSKVIIVGGPPSFPDDLVEQLEAEGCQVTQILGDGTSIAIQLETM